MDVVCRSDLYVYRVRAAAAAYAYHLRHAVPDFLNWVTVLRFPWSLIIGSLPTYLPTSFFRTSKLEVWISCMMDGAVTCARVY